MAKKPIVKPKGGKGSLFVFINQHGRAFFYDEAKKAAAVLETTDHDGGLFDLCPAAAKRFGLRPGQIARVDFAAVPVKIVVTITEE